MEWKYSCGTTGSSQSGCCSREFTCFCGFPFGCCWGFPWFLPCTASCFPERQTIPQWCNLLQFLHLVLNAGQSERLDSSWLRPQFPNIFMLLLSRVCFAVSYNSYVLIHVFMYWDPWYLPIVYLWLPVSCVLAMSIALSKIRLESCSSNLACTFELLEPKIRAPIRCSSALEYLLSLTRTLTFFKNESTGCIKKSLLMKKIL